MISYVVVIQDDEGGVRLKEVKFEDRNAALDYMKKVEVVFQRKGYVVEWDEEDRFTAVSSKNPLLRFNVFIIQVIDVER
ncbi:MAG: hypothetical protein H0Z19_11825 [Archaeoglobus sp.]|uniref:hypothetical protein n=1 Tax=Archaeoglobus sp. TaxID=1872626 RepID=UPI001DCDEA23|nr:hypothetical protein [Archaeoglobus sp.]MBO8181137.1 hypothetical protein [Archaeoglobus sp.]